MNAQRCGRDDLALGSMRLVRRAHELLQRISQQQMVHHRISNEGKKRNIRSGSSAIGADTRNQHVERLYDAGLQRERFLAGQRVVRAGNHVRAISGLRVLYATDRKLFAGFRID
ncbi:hypothetical protein SDC9_157504 [bioreactor metagenome]|uniref:Uncharacterized protein n=1 Tax=bioreactor metagenome TaxID=1076179 RepID=A0A645FA60_9ZZZZ